MIKKIALILMLSFMVLSCGKKGDPEYKADIPNFYIDKV